MSKYISPKNDLIFKRIFGEHPELLKSFLNAVLPLPKESIIESLEYLPSENVPEIPNFKYSIVDVRCQDQKGNQFIVEMQLQWSKHFVQRMVFNTSASYVRQLKKGELYHELSPVYGLAIIDAIFDREVGEEEWFHHYRLAHTLHPEKYFRDIQLVLIELPKIKPTSFTEKKLAVLWLRFLKEIDENTEEIDPSLSEEPSIKEALSLVERSAYTRQQLEVYEKNWDAIRSEMTLIQDNRDEYYSKGRKDGKEEGRAEGIEEGLQKGIEEGLQKGKQEGLSDLLKKQLQKRFGEKALSYFSMIEEANAASLEKWISLLFEAEDIEAVFKSNYAFSE